MSCYIIKSRLNGLVLDVAGEGGPWEMRVIKVIPRERLGRDSQQWYDDVANQTIRSKWNNGCFTVENDQLYLKDFQPGNNNQKWIRQGDVIKNPTNNKVLDIYGENKEPGAQIGWYDQKSGSNQKWDFEPVAGSAPGVASAPAASSPYYQGVKREFHIESLMNGKVLDICRSNKDPGTEICVWDKHSGNEKNQLFYLDAQGFIRASLNDLAITNGAKGDKIVTGQPGDPRSQFHFQGDKIVNKVGECLDIARAKDKNGAEVCTWEQNNGKNQCWKPSYRKTGSIGTILTCFRQ